MDNDISAKFCTECGNLVTPNMKFCAECGPKIDKEIFESQKQKTGNSFSQNHESPDAKEEIIEYKYSKGDKIFKDYVVIKPLGRGGFGEVYKCRNESGFIHAAKVMYDNEARGLTRKKRERLVSTLTQIKHRRLVKVNDVGINEENRFVIIMECLEGATLEEIILRKQPDEKKAEKYFVELLEILDALEKKGLVHRDIKPENIFVEDDYIRLGDYDLLKFTSGNSGDMTTKLGTLAYMCPERFNDEYGEYGYGADIWSVFCVFFELLTGKKAFSGREPTQVIGAVASCRYKKELLDIKYLSFFDKQFNPDPNKRYKSIKEVKEAFYELDKKESGFDGKFKKITFKQGKNFTNFLGMEFVWIEPGTFVMGSPESEPERQDDENQHTVRLTKGFYMQTTQVTQGQWKAIMGNNPSVFDDCGEDCPVENVSWNDTKEFIKKLNNADNDIKYRLPTESEWEYSCRAGTTTPFYFGECLSTEEANYDGNYPMDGCSKGKDRESPIPVGSLKPNAWGLYDMHGNVGEWCEDCYGEYPTGVVTDPPGAEFGSSRVIRGGGWSDVAGDCRSANRDFGEPGDRGNELGFRLVAFEAGR